MEILIWDIQRHYLHSKFNNWPDRFVGFYYKIKFKLKGLTAFIPGIPVYLENGGTKKPSFRRRSGIFL